MQPAASLIPRHAQTAVTAALSDTRVVVINGARQTGKSTLARLVMADFPGSELRFLDEAPVRAAALADPALFVRHSGLLVIDEVQRAPDLFLAIKHEVDTDPRPGRFLLTGSARLTGLRDIPDLLPGRSETIELYPLSQGEIDRRPDGFVAAVLRHGVALRVPASDLRRDDYLERALRGGYPEAVRRTDTGRRARFFESYISDLVNRDVRQLTDIERPADMRRLVNLVAASTGSLAVPASMASRLQVPASTVKRYLDLLDLLFVTRRIPAWSSNLATRAVATPPRPLRGRCGARGTVRRNHRLRGQSCGNRPVRRLPRHPTTRPATRRPANRRNRPIRRRPGAPFRRTAPRLANLSPVDAPSRRSWRANLSGRRQVCGLSLSPPV